MNVADANFDADATLPPLQAPMPQRLVLTWGAHEREVNQTRPTLTVGREETNGIVVKSDQVSRLHARIEYRHGHYTLSDQSGNGTYIADAAGRTCKVNRDTHVLLGTGTISFGINPDTGRAQLFKYTVSA